MKRWAILILMLLFMAAVRGVMAQAPGGQDRLLELKKRLDQAEASIPLAQRLGPGRVADARLAFRKAFLLTTGRAPFLVPHQTIETAFHEAERAIAAINTPPEPGPRTGFQERAYVSAIDGSPEPYALYVPTRYTPDRAWPLLIFLHGYASDLTALNWLDYMYSPELQMLCEREGVVLLLPYGRSNTEFMGIGESDVLETLRLVREEYRIDPQRVILSGASMGGSGAYSIACHHPHLFAGVIAITGRVDYYEWMKVAKESLPRFKQVQIDTDYARELLPNLAHAPVLIFHGLADSILPIAQSRKMASLLKELGQPVELVELSRTGHNDAWTPSFQHERFREALRSWRAPGAPMRVRYRTFTVKYPTAYWATIEEIDQWGEMAEIEVVVKRENLIEVTTKNVNAIRLGPGIPMVQPKLAHVRVNGEMIQPAGGTDGTLRVRLAPAPEGPLRKTPELCGPIREAYDGPFMIVVPSATGPAADADRETGRRLFIEWNQFAQGWAIRRNDTQVSGEDLRHFNLILCGSPETNRLLARVADALPLKIETEHYRIGAHSFLRKGNGAQMIYPNPLNPSRYVLVVDGAPWGPKLQANHKLDFLPDFIIYSGETDNDRTWFPTNQYLCAGYFDGGWQLSERSTWLAAPQP